MDTIPLLKEKRIVLGVTGGIAAYKTCILASHLTQAGAHVDVVMTDAAARFVGPLTFEALTGRPVYTSLWKTAEGALPTHIAHVGLGHAADLLVIAPTTANTIAKLAQGLADDLLSTLALAARCPVLLAPAMDVGMWSHSATQANVETLRRRGVRFAGPARGRMASGLEGEGRFLEPDQILGHIRLTLGRNGTLSGRRIVVTAGPTREFLDPVRFLSNPSSGRQGFALAQAALDRGAEVTLVKGPTDLSPPVGAACVEVTSAEEVRQAVLDAVAGADGLLMAAAVADYRPQEAAVEKMKKNEGDVTLRLTRTADVLAEVADQRASSGYPRVVVGFAAETEDLINNARAKLEKKGLDLIVANDVTAPRAGFGVETNRVVLLDRDGSVDDVPLMTKSAVAEVVLERVSGLLGTDVEL
jgi:phosphopantothenoylcysteine decarboxylase/phosphopantothenate--cysteine ligase